MTELCDFEYSRDLLNSNSDFNFIGSVLHNIKEIKLIIINSLGATGSSESSELKKTKKMVYDFTTERNARGKHPDKRFDVELSWKYAMDMIVKELKNTFPDSKVYSAKKEIYDISDKVTNHRLIIVDWN